VESIAFETHDVTSHATNLRAIDELKQRGVVEDGDLVIVTKGDHNNLQGGTNGMKVLRVGDTS
jgi:pyruvate kinase